MKRDKLLFDPIYWGVWPSYFGGRIIVVTHQTKEIDMNVWVEEDLPLSRILKKIDLRLRRSILFMIWRNDND
jgi:hypothetical protein